MTDLYIPKILEFYHSYEDDSYKFEISRGNWIKFLFSEETKWEKGKQTWVNYYLNKNK